MHPVLKLLDLRLQSASRLCKSIDTFLVRVERFVVVSLELVVRGVGLIVERVVEADLSVLEVVENLRRIPACIRVLYSVYIYICVCMYVSLCVYTDPKHARLVSSSVCLSYDSNA